MHEIGILVHMAKTLKSLAEENQLTEIGGITLEVGEVSGIVPEYMTDCGKTYQTVKYGKQCPHCESYDTYLLEGNGCNIKEIEAC